MAEIDVSNLKPNSNKYKNSQNQKTSGEKEKLKPLEMKGSVNSSKKSLMRKIAESFVEEDTKDIKEYIIFEKIIPGLKNLVLDALEMRFFGAVSGRSRDYRYYNNSTGGSRFDYRSRYNGGSNGRPARSTNRDSANDYQNDKVDYRRIILDYRDDAEEVVRQMRDRIRATGSASIADLFNLLGIPSEYTDNDWGWEHEDEINWKRISNGFLINVPNARPLYD